MDTHKPGIEESDDDGTHAQRLQAISRLAQQAQAHISDATARQLPESASVPLSLRARKVPQQRLRLIASVFLALTVIVAGGLAVRWHIQTTAQSKGGHQPGAIHAIPTLLTIHMETAHIYCPTSAAWSPDALHIAIVGMREGCPLAPGAETPPVVAVFNARTGDLEHVLDSGLVLAGQHQYDPPPSLIWSPDGKALIFPYSTVSSTTSGFVADLILLPINGRAPQLLTGPQVAEFLATSLVWDVRNGTAAVTFPAQPAVAYSWTSDGHILAGATTEPGNGSFSFWQPGVLIPEWAPESNDSVSPPDALLYGSVITKWSPDEQYLTAPLWVSAALPPVRGNTLRPISTTYCTVWNMPTTCTRRIETFPDRALMAVAQASMADYASEGMNSLPMREAVSLAWRPDGQILAAILPKDSFDSGNPSVRISFFNAFTGGALTTLSLNRLYPQYSRQSLQSALAWSPTGQQLALVDYGDNQVTIWGSSSLPSA
ncbi:MAG: hypothetical protein OJF49_002112 [Ktedonobacterales bacterium]|jgi:hypothetical protein|nr:MAG: hypothetical protein OJF49_002112 [Ktedonobacterales bacterium]